MIKTTLTILSLLFIHSFAFSQAITGIWNGHLEVQPGKKMLFIFQVSDSDNKLETTIAIPAQGVKGIKTSSTIFEKGMLMIDASNVGFKFKGKWNEDFGTIDGNFQEGVNSVPLVLSKEVIEEVKLNRPQEPIKPYPYDEETVKFENKAAQITLSGTLTRPKSTQKKFPVVILISGSGPQDRDESFAGHKPFLVIADYFTRNGIAVLRYDDRGFGESTGNFSEATTADFAQDVLSAIDFLKGRTDIDVSNIGLVGHSEGAIIAPMVANLSKQVAFIIMLAGTGTAGKYVSLTQALDYRNFPVADEKKYELYVSKAIEIASSEKETELVKKELTTFYNNSEMLASVLPANTNKEEFIKNLVSSRTNPWIRYFYHYNPSTELRKISIPVLALYGSNDSQVPPKHHLAPVKKALASGHSKDYEVILLEGLNHLFQESQTGNMAEYAQIEQTISPQVLEIMRNWILKKSNN